RSSDPQHRRLGSPAPVRAKRLGIDAVQTVEGLGFEELDLPTVAKDGLPRLGDGDRIRPPNEHLPEAGLEGADALAGRRGGDAEDEGCTFDGAFVHGGGERLDVLDIHEAILHQNNILLFFLSPGGAYS